MILLIAPVRARALMFTEATDEAGLRFTHGYRDSLVSPDGSFDERRHFAGGAAAGDYDNDGWTDLYAVRGDIGSNLLFHNRGDGSFEEVGAAAGVALAAHVSSGPLFVDLDGDGWLDLVVGTVEPAEGQRAVYLFRNRGDGTFEDVAIAGQLDVTRNTFSIAAGDYDRDGDLDLALAHWNSLLSPGQSSETLWRNDGSFHFSDVSDVSGLSAALLAGQSFAFDFSFTPTFADIDNDGWPDLLLAADIGTSRVFLNAHDGSFRERTDRTVINDENGMGSAVADYDGDGDLDWFVSSIWDPAGSTIEHWGVSGNRLYRNRGDGRFDDVTDLAGVRNGYWGWAATWGDFDNDGDLDLVHTNGFGRSADYLPTQSFFADPTRLFVANGDGTFDERAAASGLVDDGMGRGVVSFDYDRDGDLDLFITRSGQQAALFRNDSSPGSHWLTVQLRGAAPNSYAVGARVYASSGASVQMRELHAGSNFESQDPLVAHFGLGAATRVDRLRVVWPDGREQDLVDVAGDQSLTISAPTATATPTPTPSATPSLTPSAEPTPVCIGDCDRDAAVTVDEIVRAVSIALGEAPFLSCPQLDINHDQAVSVDEILAAVRHALDGC